MLTLIKTLLAALQAWHSVFVQADKPGTCRLVATAGPAMAPLDQPEPQQPEGQPGTRVATEDNDTEALKQA